jgi:hypothetical protein
MSNTFHSVIKRMATYRATMLVEVFINQSFSEDHRTNLALNVQRGFFENTLDVSDAVYNDAVKNKLIPNVDAYTYSQITQEISHSVIATSAKRAVAFIRNGQTVDKNIAAEAIENISIELQYLWLRVIEPFYERFPAAA